MPTINKTTQALVDKILADGLKAFIGDGLTVEIATKRIDPRLRDGGSVWENGKWQAILQILPIEKSKLRSPARRNWREGGGPDATLPHIRAAGVAGSLGRLEAMQAHVMAHEILGDDASVFTVSDDEIAIRCAAMFLANISPDKYDGLRKEPRKSRGRKNSRGA